MVLQLQIAVQIDHLTGQRVCRGQQSENMQLSIVIRVGSKKDLLLNLLRGYKHGTVASPLLAAHLTLIPTEKRLSLEDSSKRSTFRSTKIFSPYVTSQILITRPYMIAPSCITAIPESWVLYLFNCSVGYVRNEDPRMLMYE